MSVNFNDSQTKLNLLRSFAGESQARNRYDFSASVAKKQSLHVIEAIFTYTAKQEQAHAKVFIDLLKQFAGSNIQIDATYPIDNHDEVLKLLRAAQHNEYQEHDSDYAGFAKIAGEEGFADIAATFNMIAKIEKTHGDRFGMFADMLEQNKLFKSDTETEWLCLNCGHIHKGKDAPVTCPVCKHPQGFFIQLQLAPYTK